MLCVRKKNKLATAISQPLYENLIAITQEKNISISEFVMMAVSMQFNRRNIKIKAVKTPKHKRIITVRVSEGFFDMVDKMSKENGCSRSWFIFNAIEYGLNYVKKG